MQDSIRYLSTIICHHGYSITMQKWLLFVLGNDTRLSLIYKDVRRLYTILLHVYCNAHVFDNLLLFLCFFFHLSLLNRFAIFAHWLLIYVVLIYKIWFQIVLMWFCFLIKILIMFWRIQPT